MKSSRGGEGEKKVELGEAGSWDLGSGPRLKKRERERQRRSLSVLEPPDLRIQFCATSSRSCAVYKHQAPDWIL